MQLTDKTEADVKGGTIIDCEASARLLDTAKVPKELPVPRGVGVAAE
jgi:UTP--glucose-1-phosphate uridylyltransferase